MLKGAMLKGAQGARCTGSKLLWARAAHFATRHQTESRYLAGDCAENDSNLVYGLARSLVCRGLYARQR